MAGVMNPAAEHALEHTRKWDALAEKYRNLFDGLVEEVNLIHARSNRLAYELIEADRRRREMMALLEHLHAELERSKKDTTRLKGELAVLRMVMDELATNDGNGGTEND
jgi:hypothetical protein